jgi:hypothetical protein
MAPPENADQDPDETEEMSINEILCGKGDYFPYLLPPIPITL